MKNTILPAVAALVSLAAAMSIFGCVQSDTGNDNNDTGNPTHCMEGAEADCENDVLTFSIAGGEEIEVSINGLAVVEVSGAEKLDADNLEVVTRRGVMFADILDQAGIGTEHDDLPVNCVARDGWDPLRTRLDGDLDRLPRLSFLREFGYVYAGSAGDKDPLYPTMDGKTLMVDYNLESDDQVPEDMGGAMISISFFRWKMVEKISDSVRGVFELDPTL